MTKHELKYLDLLELAVGEHLHGPGLKPLPEHGRRHRWWSPLLNAVALAVRRFGVVLCLPRSHPWPDRGDTMLTPSALRNIRDTLVKCEAEGVVGDYVECGTWRGGSCVYARAVLDALWNATRRVVGCDSFEGLPLPSGKDPKNDAHHTYTALAACYDTVTGLSAKYGVGPIEWRKGFFKDSLPTLAAEFKMLHRHIAVLRCDGDLYSSTTDILTHLYPLVVRGGFVIVDDYHKLPQCRQAVKDYFGHEPPVRTVSSDLVVMWRKW